MKKFNSILVLLFFAISFNFSKAQLAYSGTNDMKLDIGINGFGYGTGVTGRFDYGILNWLSVGAGADFYWTDYHDHGNFFVYGRANVHVNEWIGLPEEMDLYPGIDIGVLNDGFGIGFHLGYRYYFTDRLGAFVELGNHGAIGVSINL